jgi:hypothetical protein
MLCYYSEFYLKFGAGEPLTYSLFCAEDMLAGKWNECSCTVGQAQEILKDFGIGE